MSVSEVIEWASLHLPFGKNKRASNMMAKYFKANDVRTVLDVGCGCGKYRVFRKYASVGCDIFPESVEIARKNRNYKTVMQLDISKDLLFGDKSFDAVVALDVMEHLGKEDSEKLSENMERIARKVVFLETTWGYDGVERAGYLFGRNPYLKHKCGWQPKEFEARGYKTIPSYTVKVGNSLAMGTLINYILAIVLRPAMKLYPEKLCRDFVAVKEIK